MRWRNLIPLLLVVAGCKTETRETYDFMFAEKPEGTILDSRLKQLQKLEQEYPKRSDIPYKMAGVYYQKEEYRESAKSLERAIDIDPREAKYHYHLGRIYMKMRELDRAEDSFRRAVELMPSDRYTGGHAALGYVLCQKGQWEAARAEFHTCARIDPADANPYYFLGCIDDARKDSRGAVSNLKEYLRRGGDLYRSKAIEILLSYGEEPPPLPAKPDSATANSGTPPDRTASAEVLREGVIHAGEIQRKEEVLGQEFGEFPPKTPSAAELPARR